MQTLTSPIIFESVATQFRQAVEEELANKSNVLVMSSADTDQLWQMYLDSWPDPEEKQGYNCRNCRHFVERYGNLLILRPDLSVVSIWRFLDPNIEMSTYMASYVESQPIKSYFFTKPTESVLGVAKNYSEKYARYWHHFSFNIPKHFQLSPGYRQTLAGLISQKNDMVNTLRRSVTEIRTETLELVLEMIATKAITMADSQVPLIEGLRHLIAEFSQLDPQKQDAWLWYKAETSPIGVVRLRQTLMGQFILDVQTALDNDSSLDGPINAWFDRNDPRNYNRPKNFVTSKQAEQFRKQLQDLGYDKSLGRRHATLDDVGEHYLWKYSQDNALEGVSESTDPLDLLVGTAKKHTKTSLKVDQLERATTMSLEEFVTKVLPKTSRLELLLKPNLSSNLVSLIAPVNEDAPAITAWDNGRSWTYAGGLATSPIAERVKKAGGVVDALNRFSLSWESPSDLDLHLEILDEKDATYDHIFFSKDRKGWKSTGYHLDVDANAVLVKPDPVENIYLNGDRIKNVKKGYRLVLYVHNYTYRSDAKLDAAGFQVEAKFGDDLLTWRFDGGMFPRHKQKYVIGVWEVVDPDKAEIKLLKSEYKFTEGGAETELWGLVTDQFHLVNLITTSPDTWDNISEAKSHLFFFLDGCENPEKVRGLFNVQIKTEILEGNKRAFEVLGGLLDVEPVPAKTQLSGIGVSQADVGRNKVLTFRVHSQVSSAATIVNVQI